MCIWLPVSMFKLGSLMNTDDKSGVGRTICSCARFLLMLWPFFLIYAPENDNRPLIGENQIFLHISPLRKNTKFEFWLFPFIRAKSRFAPLCNGKITVSRAVATIMSCLESAQASFLHIQWFNAYFHFKCKSVLHLAKACLYPASCMSRSFTEVLN